jgi:CheY-like chemotaxis protein
LVLIVDDNDGNRKLARVVLRADGFETVEAATGAEGIPVVALSVMPLEESGEWLKAAGFAGWLAKPIRVGTFPEQVRLYCAGE